MKKVNIDFISPMEGTIIPIETVKDDIFSDKVMGDGFAINPIKGEVVAPFDGEIRVLYPGGHAIVIANDTGVSVMIHIGLELYKLGPELFKVYVKQGQIVKKGEILIKINMKKAIKSKLSLVSPIVFINKEKVKVLKSNVSVKLKEGNLLEIYTES